MTETANSLRITRFRALTQALQRLATSGVQETGLALVSATLEAVSRAQTCATFTYDARKLAAEFVDGVHFVIDILKPAEPEARPNIRLACQSVLSLTRSGLITDHVATLEGSNGHALDQTCRVLRELAERERNIAAARAKEAELLGLGG